MAKEELLREPVEHLAPIERGPCSPGEAQAADWIAQRLTELGCEVEIEPEEAYTNYAKPLAALTAIAAGAGLAHAITGRLRRTTALLGAAIAAEIAEDVSNGPRFFRGVTMEKQPTQNVVARTGDPDGEHTVVVLAHHDAAPTGAIFDQSAHKWVGRNFPGWIESQDTAIPLWWPVIGAPALIASGARSGRRGRLFAGIGLALGAAASFADIARNRIVPGANDNLTGVSVLFHLASAFKARAPSKGLRVLLVSCGAEEVLQGGIHGFLARHGESLPTDTTWFVNCDTVGGPRLILLEGEGETVMEDYWDRSFRDLCAQVAQDKGIALRRGMRARTSTDSVVPNRARYPVLSLASMDAIKALPHYHLMTDVPENVRFETVADAADLVEALVRELARRAPAS